MGSRKKGLTIGGSRSDKPSGNFAVKGNSGRKCDMVAAPGRNKTPSGSPKHLPVLEYTVCSANAKFVFMSYTSWMCLTVIKTKRLTENN